MKVTGKLGRVIAALAVILAPLPTWAHHATGRPPETAFEGLLTGLAHPVIGLDHLLFLLVLAALVATQRVRGRAKTVAALCGGSFVGASVHLAGFDLPGIEPMIAVSIVAAGALLGIHRASLHPVIVAVAGVVHGYAFAGSAIGAPLPAQAAYLIGLTVTQSVILIVVTARADHTLEPAEAPTPAAGRAVGLAASVTGVLLLGLLLV